MLNRASASKDVKHVAHTRYVARLKQMGRRNAHGVADKPDIEPFLVEEETELRLREELGADLGDGTRLTEVEVLSWSQVFGSLYAKYCLVILCMLIGMFHLVRTMIYQ